MRSGDVDLRSAVPRPGVRVRLVAALHRWVRHGPWLVPVGAVLMVLGLSRSLLGGALGAIVVGVGIAASLWQPRLRRHLRRATNRSNERTR